MIDENTIIYGELITVGDSVIMIMTGEDHYTKGYAFALALYKSLSCMTFNFNYLHDVKVGFGIGLIV